MTALDRASEAYPDFDVIIRAPGRANLIGEHTDYNAGLVLPVALELDTVIAGRRTGGSVRLRSLELEGRVDVDPKDPDIAIEGWARYVAAVARALADNGRAVSGFDGIVTSDIPSGAGLSSSAALEIAVALAVCIEPPGPLELARICRRAENVYVGVPCGIMDQLTSASALAGRALLIDCRDESTRFVELPDDLSILVIDSGVSRALAGSAYAERVAECREAARTLGLGSLRDASVADLGRLDGVLLRRARHVVTENDRVMQVVRALESSDLERLGSLFDESHRSLADDYEVSSPALDALVEIAAATEGILAARLTGAGFGGCIVCIAMAGRARAAGEEVAGAYEKRFGTTARFWVSSPGAGATVS